MKPLALIGLVVFCVSASAGAQQPPAGKDEVPAEFKPPKGMCRIWLKDVPPKQQPAPTDCAAAVKNVPPNGRVIFGDSEAKDEKRGKAKPIPPVKRYTGKGAPPPVKPIKPPAH